MAKKALLIIPYLFAYAVLVILLWACGLAVSHPDSGVTWSFTTGIISRVDSNGPAVGKLMAGDRIIDINGVPVPMARDLPNSQPGDQIVYRIERDGKQFRKTIFLIKPSLQILWNRVVLFILAFTFWLPGLLVLARGRFQKETISFFLFHLGMSAVLSLGNISAYGPLWVGWAFKILLWWIGPLVFDLHTTLLGSIANRFVPRLVVKLLFFASLIFSLLDISRVFIGGLDRIVVFQYMWISFHFLLAILLLLVAFSNKFSHKLQGQIGLVLLGAIVGFSPFVLLSLLPEAVFGEVFIPYDVSFLTLSAVPVAYSLTVFRYQFLKIERYVNRGAACSLAITILGCIYAFVFRFIWHTLSLSLAPDHWLAFLLIVIFAFLTNPLFFAIQRIVNRVFYGDWWNNEQAIALINTTLSTSGGDIIGFASVLCRAIQKTLQLDYVNLCLIDGWLISSGRTTDTINEARLSMPPEVIGKLLHEFRIQYTGEFGKVDHKTPNGTLSNSITSQLFGPHPYAWILLKGFSGDLGIAILGMKRGGGGFEAHDLEVLQAVVHQGRYALENALLNKQLIDRNTQVEKLNRQVFQVREEERKRIARDLHDQTIQSLIAVNFKLDVIKGLCSPEGTVKLKEMRGEIRTIIGDLRQICTNLRPSALDTLGLASALRSRIDELSSQVPFSISLMVYGNEEQDIPDAVCICLYRFFQEALLNAMKHSQASNVSVSLEIFPDEVIMTIADDGQGFTPPDQIGSLVKGHHFGLLGIQELLDSIHGKLEVNSSNGCGCKIIAHVLLAEKESESEQK